MSKCEICNYNKAKYKVEVARVISVEDSISDEEELYDPVDMYLCQECLNELKHDPESDVSEIRKLKSTNKILNTSKTGKF